MRENDERVKHSDITRHDDKCFPALYLECSEIDAFRDDRAGEEEGRGGGEG